MADELQAVSNQLPANVEDLSKYVFVGREKLVALQAELRAIDKVGLAAEVRKQKLTEAQDIADALLLAEMRLGELISEIPESPGKRTDLEPEDTAVQKSKKEVLQEIGFSVKTAQRFEKLAKHPEIVASMSAEARAEDAIVSRTAVLRAISSSESTSDTPKTHKAPVMPVYEGEEEDERLTPQKYITSARKVLGKWITDPAASRFKDISKHGSFNYYKPDNGLSKTWGISTIWLFPPYYDTARFVKKLLDGETNHAIVLVNNETESKWFKDLWNRANAVVFNTGKIQFEIPEGTSYTGPDCGQVFFYIGYHPDAFIDEFSKYGVGIKLRENMADGISHSSELDEPMDRQMSEEDKEIVIRSLELNKKAEERHKKK